MDQILTYDKFKHSDDGFQYFIGYKKIILLDRCVLSYLKWENTLKKYVPHN